MPGGPGRFGERRVGARLPWGVLGRGHGQPPGGSRRGADSPTLPRFPGVSARDVAEVGGGRRGVSGAGERAESGGGRSFFVSGSAAFSPWQSGQGTRGDLCVGGGDPRAQAEGGSSAWARGKGSVPSTHRHAHAPPADPGRPGNWALGLALGPLDGERAGLRRDPSPAAP